MNSIYGQLHRAISSITEFSATEWEMLEEAFVPRHVPRRHELVASGSIARELYFINSGAMRFYYPKNGEEITGYIYLENSFAGSFESFLRQSPGIQVFETLEDCELLTVSYRALQELYGSLPKMNEFMRKITEQRFINAQQILTSYILDSPEERYLGFIKQHPEIMKRVPQHMIASFLGITPVSLSRIRKRIAS